MKRKGPKVTQSEVERLVTLLNAATDNRMLASELATAMWGQSTDNLKRRVRAIAAAAGTGVISYPGSPGYALWKRCSVDELHACLGAWNDQINDMTQTRDAIRIRLHQENPANFESNIPALRPREEQLSLI